MFCRANRSRVPRHGRRENDDGIAYTDGRVGIGTETPATDLDVNGGIKAARFGLNETTYIQQDAFGGLSIFSGGLDSLDVKTDGNVNVPMSLTVGGFCSANCTSDARLKTSIAPIDGALARLLALRGVSFEWKDPSAQSPGDCGPQIGFIAQEVETVFPEWVTQGRDGYRRLFIRGFEALSVEAFRTLAAQNGDLRSRVRALEEKNARLSAKMSALGDQGAAIDALVRKLDDERRARAAIERRLAALEAATKR